MWQSSGVGEVNFQLKGMIVPFNKLVAVKTTYFMEDEQSVK